MESFITLILNRERKERSSNIQSRLKSVKKCFKNCQSSITLNYGLPEFVDWELQGAVNVPRDQGSCGSCWAHLAVGAIEVVHQIVWVSSSTFSSKVWLICGLPEDAFIYVMKFGLTTDEAYPLRWFLGHWRCKSARKVVHVVINDPKIWVLKSIRYVWWEG